MAIPDAQEELLDRGDVQCLRDINLALGDLATRQLGSEQHAGGFDAERHALRLDPPLEFLMQLLNGVGR
jgi:hypothetical protein